MQWLARIILQVGIIINFIIVRGGNSEDIILAKIIN